MRAFVGLALPPSWVGPLVSAQGRVRGGNRVTLVRFAASAPADTDRLQGTLTRLGAPDLPSEMATGLTLWSSLLTPQGPIYEPLSTYPLRAA